MSISSLEALQKKKERYKREIGAYEASLQRLNCTITEQQTVVAAGIEKLRSLCTATPTTTDSNENYVRSLSKLPQAVFKQLMQNTEVVQCLKGATAKNYQNVQFTSQEHSNLLRTILKSPIAVNLPLCLIFKSKDPKVVVSTQKEIKQHQTLLEDEIDQQKRLQTQISTLEQKIQDIKVSIAEAQAPVRRPHF